MEPDLNDVIEQKKQTPGGYYSVNQDMIFPVENEFGIPTMLKVSVDEIDLTLPILEYRSRDKDGICHFFLEDYRFEAVWNVPVKGLKSVLEYKGAFSPNFSLYRDWPPAINIWNTYRSRWCGRLWQDHGQKVIPSVCWSCDKSFDYAYLGIPKGSVVAITYMKFRFDESRKFFWDGYEEMLKRIEPEKILIYSFCGNIPDEFSKNEKIIVIDSFWRRKNKQVLKAKLNTQEIING